MADEKISLMTAATALSGAELMEVVQGGGNKKTTVDQIANAGAVAVSFNTAIPFNRIGSAMYLAVTGNTIFTKNTAGTIPNGGTMVCVEGDGSHTVDLTDFKKWNGSQNFDPANGVQNFITFFALKNGPSSFEYFYTIGREEVSSGAWAVFEYQNVGSGVTRTGDDYTGKGNVSSTSKIAGTTGGAIRFKKISSAFEDIVLGLDLTSTLTPYSGMEYGVIQNPAGYDLYPIFQGMPVGTGAITGQEIALNDYLALYVNETDGEVTIRRSVDAGVTFTTIYTFPTKCTADLYPCAQLAINISTSTIFAPEGQNLV